jgi:hypothetical protein
MQTTRLSTNERSQVDKTWETFLHGLDSFSDDFMSEGRLEELEQKREEL